MCAPLAFLYGPLRSEELLAELDQLGNREFEFFAILKVAGNSDFLADQVLGSVLRPRGGKHSDEDQQKRTGAAELRANPNKDFNTELGELSRDCAGLLESSRRLGKQASVAQRPTRSRRG